MLYGARLLHPFWLPIGVPHLGASSVSSVACRFSKRALHGTVVGRWLRRWISPVPLGVTQAVLPVELHDAASADTDRDVCATVPPRCSGTQAAAQPGGQAAGYVSREPT